MNEHILKDFFDKNLPLYPPLEDDFLGRFKTDDLLKRNFRYLFSVDDMVRISDRLENLIISIPGASDVHVSFQYMSRFKPQANRYKKIAQASKNLWIYGTFDTTLPPLENARLIDTTATKLVDYWFIILHGRKVGATLLAADLTPLGDEKQPRRYEGFYTFDPMTAQQLISVLHQYFPESVSKPS